jgi:hypothetical protein
MQAVYTIGQRLIFFFPITVMWFLGPTALLCTSVLVTSAVAFLDRWDPKNPQAHVDKVLKYTHTNSSYVGESTGPTEASPSAPAVAKPQSPVRAVAAGDAGIVVQGLGTGAAAH